MIQAFWDFNFGSDTTVLFFSFLRSDHPIMLFQDLDFLSQNLEPSLQHSEKISNESSICSLRGFLVVWLGVHSMNNCIQLDKQSVSH